MFNLLWLRDTTQKVTGTWNFDNRCGFRDCSSYKNTSYRCQFFLSEENKLQFTTDLPVKESASTTYFCQELPTQMLYVFLLDLKESALLITANNTDVHCRRALCNNESIFLSSGREAHYWSLEQISAYFSFRPPLVRRYHPWVKLRVKSKFLFMTFIYNLHHQKFKRQKNWMWQTSSLLQYVG